MCGRVCVCVCGYVCMCAGPCVHVCTYAHARVFMLARVLRVCTREEEREPRPPGSSSRALCRPWAPPLRAGGARGTWPDVRWKEGGFAVRHLRLLRTSGTVEHVPSVLLQRRPLHGRGRGARPQTEGCRGPCQLCDRPASSAAPPRPRREPPVRARAGGGAAAAPHASRSAPLPLFIVRALPRRRVGAVGQGRLSTSSSRGTAGRKREPQN